jgi:hypothetical protein
LPEKFDGEQKEPWQLTTELTAEDKMRLPSKTATIFYDI